MPARLSPANDIDGSEQRSGRTAPYRRQARDQRVSPLQVSECELVGTSAGVNQGCFEADLAFTNVFPGRDRRLPAFTARAWVHRTTSVALRRA